MSDMSVEIGLASASAGAPPPNASATGLRDEGPRHRLDQTARRQRALGAAGAGLDQRQHRPRDVIGFRQRRRGHAVDAEDAHDFLDEIGLAFDIRPPGRHPDRQRRRGARDGEAERRQHVTDLVVGRIDAGEPLHFGRPGRRSTSRGSGTVPATTTSLGTPPQRSSDQPRRKLEAGQHEGRIDAALEAVARIGIDAELAAGLGDGERLPQRRFDQHVDGLIRAAGSLAAHDAGERLDAVVVGDDAHRRIERIGLAVERQQALAGPARAARRGRHATLAASKTCSGRPRSKVRKLVMSTSALIGRRPMARSFACIHSGDGPFLTPRTSRRPKAGDRAPAIAEIEARRRPGTGTCPRPARRRVASACRDRRRRDRARRHGRRGNPGGSA